MNHLTDNPNSIVNTKFNSKDRYKGKQLEYRITYLKEKKEPTLTNLAMISYYGYIVSAIWRLSLIHISGAAGFIGSNLAKRLITDYKDIKVIGLDTMTDSYDDNIKKERLRGIEARGGNWSFVEESIANKEVIDKIFTKNRISVVVNLAAQAGVRYSITNPDAYIQSNLIGFYNILEARCV